MDLVICCLLHAIPLVIYPPDGTLRCRRKEKNEKRKNKRKENLEILEFVQLLGFLTFGSDFLVTDDVSSYRCFLSRNR